MEADKPSHTYSEFLEPFEWRDFQVTMRRPGARLMNRLTPLVAYADEWGADVRDRLKRSESGEEFTLPTYDADQLESALRVLAPMVARIDGEDVTLTVDELDHLAGSPAQVRVLVSATFMSSLVTKEDAKKSSAPS